MNEKKKYMCALLRKCTQPHTIPNICIKLLTPHTKCNIAKLQLIIECWVFTSRDS